ncbi:DUF4373 domain-containing protein [bacterium]|jgi:hypothetical protein|nr:DUF4373 domain-containing protein [bacterium]
MKEVPYFSHDSNARNDLKLASLIEDHEIEAYGIYWVIVEMMREQDEFRLPWGHMTFSGIAKAVGQKGRMAKIQALIMEMADPNKYDLFKKEGDYFFSESLRRRMSLMQEKKQKFSKAGKASAEARQGHTSEHTIKKMLTDGELQRGICDYYKLTAKQFKSKLEFWIAREKEADSLSRPYPELKKHFFNSLNIELNGTAGKNRTAEPQEEPFVIPSRG